MEYLTWFRFFISSYFPLSPSLCSLFGLDFVTICSCFLLWIHPLIRSNIFTLRGLHVPFHWLFIAIYKTRDFIIDCLIFHHFSQIIESIYVISYTLDLTTTVTLHDDKLFSSWLSSSSDPPSSLDLPPSNFLFSFWDALN